MRIPGAPFMGISATAPTSQKLKEWSEHEQRSLDAGGFVIPPGAAGAVPGGRCGMEALRTIPPRENGGNFHVNQLTKEAKLLLPVFTKAALFSTGDAHFAKAMGRCASLLSRCKQPWQSALGCSRVSRKSGPSPDLFSPTAASLLIRRVPKDLLDVMGEIESENLALACRNATLNMMTLLPERGFGREQAYVICSVAVDLRISNVVDAPNFVVSALLPETIFGQYGFYGPAG
jgi:formamidase